MTHYIPNPSDIESVEQRLAAAFARVKPREEFIGDLRQRLIYPAPEVMAVHPSQVVWWILLASIGGFLLFLGILVGVLLQKRRSKA